MYMCVMREIPMLVVQMTFTIFVLQATRMRVTPTSGEKDYKEIKEIQGAKADEQFIKKFIGQNVGSDVTKAKARHTPSYLLLLYTSLEGFEEIKQGPNNAYPKIRSYRGLKGRSSQHHKCISFSMSNVKWDDVTRMEIVIKLTKKIRFRSVADLDQNVTLIVHAENKDTFGVEAHIYDTYLIFDTSVLKNSHLSMLTIDMSLFVDDEKITISRVNEPLLLIYEHLQQNPLLNKRRVRRDVDHVGGLYDNVSDTETDLFSCGKYDWYIDVSVFTKFTWWIQPRVYNAGFCSGRCMFPLNSDTTNSTSYSFLKNVWFVETFGTDESIPRACCVPVDYYPLRILYLTDNLEADIMYIADMKVKSCGCR